MKYIIFAGQRFYARGGAFDIVGFRDDMHEACELAEFRISNGDDWAHVVNRDSGDVIWKSGEALGQFDIEIPRKLPIGEAPNWDADE